MKNKLTNYQWFCVVWCLCVDWDVCGILLGWHNDNYTEAQYGLFVVYLLAKDASGAACSVVLIWNCYPGNGWLNKGNHNECNETICIIMCCAT